MKTCPNCRSEAYMKVDVVTDVTYHAFLEMEGTVVVQDGGYCMDCGALQEKYDNED